MIGVTIEKEMLKAVIEKASTKKKHSILGLIPLFQVLQEMGVDPERMLRNHQIDLDSLSGSALIEQDVELALIAEALDLIDDPTFGLRVGGQGTFTSYGTYALLLMTSSNLLEACHTAVQFQALSLLFCTMSLYQGRDYYELQYTLPIVPTDVRSYIADRDFAGTYGFLTELLKNPEELQVTAGIARPKPGEELLRAYQKIASVSLQFDQPYSWFRIPVSLLSGQFRHGNELAHKLYRVQAQELLRQFYSGSEDIVTQVRQVIESYDGDYPKAETIARRFGMSERSLRRKLDESRVSYRLLVDEHRKLRALNLLSAEDLSVGQMAERLAYSETASFLRAFKRWTGMTPKQYVAVSREVTEGG